MPAAQVLMTTTVGPMTLELDTDNAPKTVEKLCHRGFSVLIEAGAGAAASYPDDQYREVGADVADVASEVWEQADILLKVRAPEDHPVLIGAADDRPRDMTEVKAEILNALGAA